jgi:hypothetical protein
MEAEKKGILITPGRGEVDAPLVNGMQRVRVNFGCGFDFPISEYLYV